jgi:adenylate cyclase
MRCIAALFGSARPRAGSDACGSSHRGPDKPSLAALPFQSMSADPEQEYFADGIVEDIITALSRVPSLFVIARNSSFSYKGKSPDIRQVGRALGVRYVLEGSVCKAGARIRIPGQ